MRLDMGAIGVGPDSTPSLPLLDTIFGRIFLIHGILMPIWVLVVT
jgi:hypothetical protein